MPTKLPSKKKSAGQKTPKKTAPEKTTAKKAAPQKSVSKKATAKKAAPKKVTAKKATAKKAAPKKATAKKATAKKAAPKKATATKGAAKKTALKKAIAKKAAPKKAAALKVVPKKAAAKKSAPQKSAARKTAPAKSAPKPAPAKTPQSNTSGPDFDAAYTLPQLKRRSGPATVEEARGLVAVPDAQLIAQGAEVATFRISTDSARMYGQTLDILARLTPKAKAALLGVTPQLLRIAIFAAQHGDELYAARNQGLALQKTRQTSRRATAATSLGRGMGRREQLRALYLSITGDDLTWRKRIGAAYGVAKEPAKLAQALTGLADLGDELLGSEDAGQRERQKDSGLTTELLAEVRSLAAEIALLGTAGLAARELSAVSQAEVDLWDGLNLTLLQRIMNLVNAAHDLEPSIPRLVPLSLRTYFFGGSSKKAATPTEPAPPAGSPA